MKASSVDGPVHRRFGPERNLRPKRRRIWEGAASSATVTSVWWCLCVERERERGMGVVYDELLS